MGKSGRLSLKPSGMRLPGWRGKDVATRMPRSPRPLSSLREAADRSQRRRDRRPARRRTGQAAPFGDLACHSPGQPERPRSPGDLIAAAERPVRDARDGAFTGLRHRPGMSLDIEQQIEHLLRRRRQLRGHLKRDRHVTILVSTIDVSRKGRSCSEAGHHAPVGFIRGFRYARTARRGWRSDGWELAIVYRAWQLGHRMGIRERIRDGVPKIDAWPPGIIPNSKIEELYAALDQLEGR